MYALPITESLMISPAQMCCPSVIFDLISRHQFHAVGRTGVTADFGNFHGHGPLDDRLRETLCHLFRPQSPVSSSGWRSAKIPAPLQARTVIQRAPIK